MKKRRSAGQTLYWIRAKSHYLRQAYAHQGLAGVVNNLRNDRVGKRLPEVVGCQPLRIVLEPSVRCNLNCRFCETNAVFRQREKKFITAADFRRILEQLPFAQSLNPTLRGEALVAPEIFEIFETAKARGMRIRMVTNGLMLTDRERRRRLIEVGVDQVVFSVDAVGERYEAIRTGARFSDLTEAVASLQREGKAARGLPRITVAVVGDGDNPDDPMHVIEWAAGMGIGEVEIQPIHNWGNEEVVVRPLNGERIEACVAWGRELGVRINVYVPSGQDPAKRHCTFPWDTVVIASDGRVTPCCVHGTDPDRLSFGNILSQPFGEIWNGEAMRGFRRELRRTDFIPSFCRGCPSY